MFSYLITDPEFYTDENFVYTLDKAIKKHNPKLACYRNKKQLNEEQIKNFALYCANNNTLAILNGNLNLAIKHGFNGVHLTSKQHQLIQICKNANLLTIASCHTRQEIIMCLNSGADYITLSPLFASPNKGEPLGISKFCELANGYFNKIIALGGIIKKEQILEISKLNLAGYASIRYFIND